MLADEYVLQTGNTLESEFQTRRMQGSIAHVSIVMRMSHPLGDVDEEEERERYDELDMSFVGRQ